ncbi:MAG: hypothetical protein K2I64_02620 [Muribaculaceae bacterium]|nr:hypothetical protein [Muribaculaceae bacterium]
MTQLIFPNITISTETIIAQYIPHDYFLEFLTSGKYYISRKHEFSDIREKNLPFASMIVPTEAQGDNYRPIDWVLVQKNELKRQELAEQYTQNANNLGVSCWTKYDGEDIFMWKEYAKKYGVCVLSTIEKFLSEFSSTEIKIHCVPIKYKGYNFSCDLIECLQRKENCYRNEREIRFYFY